MGTQTGRASPNFTSLSITLSSHLMAFRLLVHVIVVKSNLPRGTPIRKSHLRSPLQEFGTAIIMRNLTLDQDGSTLMTASLFDRVGQFLCRCRFQTQSLPVIRVE